MSFQARFDGNIDDVVPAVDPSEQFMIIHINRRDGNCLVKKGNNKAFPCTLAHWLKDSISIYDYVDIEKSNVTGEWVVTDYFINHEVTAAIHNSYQDSYDDMVLKEDGVPYGYWFKKKKQSNRSR